MPLDRWMPAWDARSAHALVIAAPRPRVFEALLDTDFGRNPVVRALMAVRLLPALLLSPRKVLSTHRQASAAQAQLRHAAAGSMLGGAFALLEHRAPEELAFGLTGRFWTLTGGLLPSDPATFHEPAPAGAARAAWTFELDAIDDGTTRLRTETRVRCSDDATRRRFLRYWTVIHPGSGIIRWAVLHQVKRAAESRGRG